MNPLTTSTTSTGFTFGTTNAPTTQPPFSFGVAAPTTVSSTPSFGGGLTTSTGGGLTFGAAAAKPPQTTGFSFGATPLSAAPSLSGFATSLSTPAPASTQPLSSTLATGFASSVAPSVATATTTASTVPMPNFSFSGTSTATSFSTPSSASTQAPPSSTSSPTVRFNLPTTVTPITGTSSTGLSLSSGSTATTATAAPATSTAPSTAQPKGSISFTQMEETINKWTIELEEQERLFLNQVDQVRDWDKLLLSTGDKIVSLNDGMQKVKLRQLQLDHELDFIVAQQRELEECLVPLEKEFADLTVSDPERNTIYERAENLNTQLQQVADQLKTVIEHVNERNTSQDATDPIVQIGKILNAHMNSLQWVDQNTAVIQQMLDQIGKMRDIHRREADSTQNI